MSLTATALPFALGAVLALYLAANHPSDSRLAFALFLGTAMSVAAFPVLARPSGYTGTSRHGRPMSVMDQRSVPKESAP